MVFTKHPALPAIVFLQIFAGINAFASDFALGQQPNSFSSSAIPSIVGPSGGLIIPTGRIFADGTAAFSVNNYLEPRFSRAHHGENYLFALGVLPYIEISGRLANYPITSPTDFALRDLSANLKIAVPKVFSWQPDISFGANDFAGGAPNFSSRYLAVSQQFGPLTATIGAAKSKVELGGMFGGAELALGNTGLSVLAERTRNINTAGLRYASAPITSFGNTQLIATAQRSFGARTLDGVNFNKPTLTLGLFVPFGDNARATKTQATAAAIIQSTSDIPTAVAMDQITAPVAASLRAESNPIETVSRPKP